MTDLTTTIEGPVAVIGDVHGQVDELAALIHKLRQTPSFADRWIVFIGDYVDRGPDPHSAVELILDLQREHGRVTAICGNHELAMGGAIGLYDTPDYSEWDKRWVDHYDADTTFASYGAPFGDLAALRDQMPESHREFFTKLPWCVRHPDYLFVHAGLESHSGYQMQVNILKARDFSLSRPAWLCSKEMVSSPVPPDCPVTVVSGHVYVPDVQFGDRRVLLDTTGGVQGDLSCVLFPENAVLTSAADSRRPVPVAATPSRKRSRASGWSQSPVGGAQANRSWWRLW